MEWQFAQPGEPEQGIFHEYIYKYRNASLHKHQAAWYFHSEEVMRHLHWNVTEEQIVADVGACFGSWTIPALLQGAFVYAYEPHPLLFKELVHNVSLNNLRGKFDGTNRAVWAESDKVLALPQLDLSMMRRDGDNQPILNVQTIALDDALAEAPRLDWLKIDVEGAEIEVLKGARKIIEKYNPRIIIEWHADRNKDPEMYYLKDFKTVQLLEPGHYLVQMH